MTEPRYQRRKEDRPAEITEAAMEAFAVDGFAATRVDDVARRAGVSKGLLYLYFKTKEELFKAVIKSFIAPKVDALLDSVDTSEASAEEFLRGPFLEFAKELPKSRARVLVRLLIAEGPKHPDLVAYYWENVVAHGIAALGKIIDRGVASGEFRRTAASEFPQLVISPVLTSIVWNGIFASHHELDTERYIEAHLDMLLCWLKSEGASS